MHMYMYAVFKNCCLKESMQIWQLKSMQNVECPILRDDLWKSFSKISQQAVMTTKDNKFLVLALKLSEHSCRKGKIFRLDPELEKFTVLTTRQYVKVFFSFKWQIPGRAHRSRYSCSHLEFIFLSPACSTVFQRAHSCSVHFEIWKELWNYTGN